MITDEFLYEMAARELAERRFSQGLMAQACARALGDFPKAQALYLQMRVMQLKSHISAARASTIVQELQRRKARRDQANREPQELAAAPQSRELEQSGRATRAEAERRLQQLQAQLRATAWIRRAAALASGYKPPFLQPKTSSKSQPALALSIQELDKLIESLQKRF